MSTEKQNSGTIVSQLKEKIETGPQLLQ